MSTVYKRTNPYIFLKLNIVSFLYCESKSKIKVFDYQVGINGICQRLKTGKLKSKCSVSHVDVMRMAHFDFSDVFHKSSAFGLWCTKRVKITGTSPLVNFHQCTTKFYRCIANVYQSTAKFYQCTGKFTSPLIKFSSALVNLPVH